MSEAPPQINLELMEGLAREFDSVLRYRVAEDALTQLVSQHPLNDGLPSVLLKVVTLNALYSTQIFATFDLAAHIVHSDVDSLLDGDPRRAVEVIASVELGGKKRHLYSFASKYCSWHRPAVFPIMDALVKRVLWAYGEPVGVQLRKADLNDYRTFYSALQAFVNHFGLTSMTWKDLDKGLWMLGKRLESTERP